MPKKYRKLTDETLLEIARKYKTRAEFFKDDPSALGVARKRTIEVPSKDDLSTLVTISLLDHICSHMEKGSTRKWTMKLLKKTAKKYKSRADFAKQDRAAYSAARRDGVMDEVCSHMPAYLSKKKREAEAAA